MKSTFNIFQDTCEPISFKLGMTLNTTKLYSLIPVWMTFMFTPGYRITENLELVRSFCCKVTWGNWNIRDGFDYVREKQTCKYVEYGSFEYFLLLLLLLLLFCFVLFFKRFFLKRLSDIWTGEYTVSSHCTTLVLTASLFSTHHHLFVVIVQR